MSYKLAHYALHAPGCKGNTKLVLIALADCYNERTGKCFPSHSTIAETIGSDRGTVVKAIAQLESLGYITCAGKHGSSLNYQLNIPQVRDIASCGKNQQVEMLGNNTKMLENSTGSVVKSDTNKESNIEVKKENSNASKARVMKPNAIIKQDAVCQLTTTTMLIPKPREVRLEAKRRLIAEGMSEPEVVKRLNEIKDEFLTKARLLKANGELEKKNNPKRYLVGMLTSMAKEGPKKFVPIECEPRKLDDIIVKLREVYKRVYPYAANKIDYILSVDNINSSTISNLRALELQGWPGISSPVAVVKSRLDGWVYRQVQQAMEDEMKSSLADLDRYRTNLANAQFELMQAQKDGAPRRAIEVLEEKVNRRERTVANKKAHIDAIKSHLASA